MRQPTVALIDGLLIRPMTANDIGPLAAVLGWPEYGLRHRWQEQLDGKREAFVAELDGTPVGSVSINEEPEVVGFLHLFALDVASRYQRRGIGTRLIAQVEAEAAERGHIGVYLDVGVQNPDARRLYERLGYVAEGEPCERGWRRPNPDGTPGNYVSEIVQRMFKRF
jgi:ribosomal protein S18 acetylase RimI-like enzyme